jgi:hypothetical protein
MLSSIIPPRPRRGDGAFVVVAGGQVDGALEFARALGADAFHARQLLTRPGYLVFHSPTRKEAVDLVRRLRGTVRTMTFDQSDLDRVPPARDVLELRVTDGGAADYRSAPFDLVVRDAHGVEDGVRLADVKLVVADRLVSDYREKRQRVTTQDSGEGVRTVLVTTHERQRDERRVLDLYDSSGAALRCLERRVRISGMGLYPQESGHAFHEVERWLLGSGLLFIDDVQTDVREAAGRLSTFDGADKRDDFATFDLRSARAWIIRALEEGAPT